MRFRSDPVLVILHSDCVQVECVWPVTLCTREGLLGTTFFIAPRDTPLQRMARSLAQEDSPDALLGAQAVLDEVDAGREAPPPGIRAGALDNATAAVPDGEATAREVGRRNTATTRGKRTLRKNRLSINVPHVGPTGTNVSENQMAG